MKFHYTLFPKEDVPLKNGRKDYNEILSSIFSKNITMPSCKYYTVLLGEVEIN